MPTQKDLNRLRRFRQRAWDLSEQTGWPYGECRQLVLEYDEDQLDALIEQRLKEADADPTHDAPADS